METAKDNLRKTLENLANTLDMYVAAYENPVRLQRSRQKKRDIPKELVQYVGRGKGWKADLLGNPFEVGEKVPQEYVELWEKVQIEHDFNDLDLQNYLVFVLRDNTPENIKEVVFLYDEYLELLSIFNPEKYAKIMELCEGKNLECWCNLNEPCHADILLRRCKEFFNE